MACAALLSCPQLHRHGPSQSRLTLFCCPAGVALDEAVEDRGGVGPGGLKLPTVDEAHPVNEESWTDGAAPASGPYTQRLQLWRTHDFFRKVFLDPGLGKMAATLAQEPGIRIWHDQTLIKEPWAPPSNFHLDNVLWSFHHHESISIWVALVRTSTPVRSAVPHTSCALSGRRGCGQRLHELRKIADAFSIWLLLLQTMFLKQVRSCRCRTPTARPWRT